MESLLKTLEAVSSKSIKIIKDSLKKAEFNLVIAVLDTEEDDDISENIKDATIVINENEGSEGWNDLYLMSITGTVHDCYLVFVNEYGYESKFELFALSTDSRAAIADFLTSKKLN